MVKGDRAFVVLMLVPAFFFLVMFYLYPTVFNLQNSFTDLNLFGLRKGGEWVGIDNYRRAVHQRRVRARPVQHGDLADLGGRRRAHRARARCWRS